MGASGPDQSNASVVPLVDEIANALLQRQQTLSAAESCTGGLIQRYLTDRPGASRFFLGGVIAYHNRVKRELLDVSESLLASEGAVSQGVAEQMARGVAQRLGTDVGIGITGVAGPGGGTEKKPVGTVWYSVWLQGRMYSELQTFAGDRHAVREAAARAALVLLCCVLSEDGANG
jgi:PncC family amidohydrolase